MPADLPLLRPVSGLAEVRASLSEALAGGPPVAPLPPVGIEREAALAMLRPDVPVVEPDAAAVVATSGSTGAPKGVVLSGSAIRAAVAATHQRLGGPGDWVLALPAHYVAGLMVVARTIVAGTDLVASGTDLTDLPEATSRTYVALVPTQLSRALEDPGLASRLASYRAVLLGGAAAESSLLRRARERGVTVVTTYGMSETCGGCVYDGVPLSGTVVDLDSDSGLIRLDGPMMFSGYRLRPDLTAATFQDGRFLTGDRGHWEGRRLVVDGRVDDVVISGGLNVDLATVERLARAWSTAEIAVVGLADPEWGTVVVAVTEGASTLDDLRSGLSNQLPAYALPRRLVSMSMLPRTSSGKIDRQRLLRMLNSGDLADGG